MSSMPMMAALPGGLVEHVKLKAPRAFHRFSAFTPDRRVNPLTGDFLPGTYASPASELTFLPTGFAVVGRLALPNNLPASHHRQGLFRRATMSAVCSVRGLGLASGLSSLGLRPRNSVRVQPEEPLSGL